MLGENLLKTQLFLQHFGGDIVGKIAAVDIIRIFLGKQI